MCLYVYGSTHLSSFIYHLQCTIGGSNVHQNAATVPEEDEKKTKKKKKYGMSNHTLTYFLTYLEPFHYTSSWTYPAPR